MNWNGSFDIDPTFYTRQVAQGKPNERYIKFEELIEEDTAASEREGRPIFKSRDIIKITFPGQKDETVRDVTEDDKRFYRASWEAFKAGSETPLNGTPLEEWPQLPRTWVQVFKRFGIRSIEMLVETPETSICKCGPEALNYQNLAKAYLAKAKDASITSQLMTELRKRDAKIDALEMQLDVLNRRYLETTGQNPPPMRAPVEVRIDEPTEAPKKRRGRPAKIKETENGN